MTRAARAGGAAEVFLLTDADDGHRLLDARVGFLDAGLMPRFLKQLG